MSSSLYTIWENRQKTKETYRIILSSKGESGGTDSSVVNDPLPPSDPFPPNQRMNPQTLTNAGVRLQPNLGPLTLNVGHDPRGFGGPRNHMGLGGHGGGHGGSLLAMAIPSNGSNVTSNSNNRASRKGDLGRDE